MKGTGSRERFKGNNPAAAALMLKTASTRPTKCRSAYRREARHQPPEYRSGTVPAKGTTSTPSRKKGELARPGIEVVNTLTRWPRRANPASTSQAMACMPPIL
jgi:hypothetical protein